MVNADRQFQADVLIRDGLILRVGPGLHVRLARLLQGGCGRAVAADARGSRLLAAR